MCVTIIVTIMTNKRFPSISSLAVTLQAIQIETIIIQHAIVTHPVMWENREC